MTHHRPGTLRTRCALAALGFSSLAFSAAFAAEVAPQDATYLPGPLSAASIGRTVLAGSFTGEDVDVIALVTDASGSKIPTLLIRPAVYGTALHATIGGATLTGIDDLAVISLPNDDRVSAVAVGSGGLYLLRYDVTTGFTATTVFGATSAWANARKIRVGKFGGDGALDLVALSATGTLLRANGSGGTFVTPAYTPVTPAAYGLEALDLTGDGDDEIALVTTNRIDLWEPNGVAPQSTFAWNSGPVLTTVIAAPTPTAPGREGLLTLATLANGSQYVRTFLGGGMSAAQGIGSLGVIALTVGDRDLDGDPDLFLANTTTKGYFVAWNTAAAQSPPTFSAPLAFLYGDQDRNPALHDAGIAFADFDRDGDGDALAFVQGNGGSVYTDFKVELNASIDENHLKPTLTDSTYHFANHDDAPPEGPGVIADPDPNAPANDRLVFELGAPSTILTAPGGVQTKYRVRAWYTAELAPNPIGTETTPYATLTPSEPAIAPTVSVIVEPPADYLESRASITLVVEQIVLDAQGAVILSGPSRTILHATEANHALAASLPGTTASSLTASVTYDGTQHTEPDGSTGSSSSGPRVPSYDPDEEPDRG